MSLGTCFSLKNMNVYICRFRLKISFFSLNMLTWCTVTYWTYVCEYNRLTSLLYVEYSIVLTSVDMETAIQMF